MAKPDTPQYPSITPSQVVTGQDATNQAMQLAQQYFPQQMGAQAQGLQDLSMGNAYYQQYQPTSFEQALGNQQFQNIWPNEQAYMQNLLSQSGMAYSPTEATTLGNAYGNLSTNIGEYLNQQGDTRATNNLNALLGINPNNYYGPISNAITGQSNEQGQLNQNANIQNANAQYSNSLANYNQGLAGNGALGQVGGMALGALLAAPTGGMSMGMGAMLGGGIGSALMGGSGGGGNLANSLLASQYLQPQGQQNTGTGYTPQSGNGAQSLSGMYSGNSEPTNMSGTSSVYSSLPQNPFQ